MNGQSVKSDYGASVQLMIVMAARSFELHNNTCTLHVSCASAKVKSCNDGPSQGGGSGPGQLPIIPIYRNFWRWPGLA
jgi:hypothetical protein